MDRPVCPFVVDMLFRPEGKPRGQSDRRQPRQDNQVGLQSERGWLCGEVRCVAVRCGAAPTWCKESDPVQAQPSSSAGRVDPVQSKCNAMRCNAIQPNPGRPSSMTWMWMDLEARGLQAEGASI